MSIFFRLKPTPVLGFTAQPLSKALHNKAFRYAVMLQRLDRHTPLPVWYYYYMRDAKICQEK